MIKWKENKRGITLIALIVTIIILIILASISIATLMEENGIISKSFIAKEEHTKEGIREKLNLELIHILSNYKIEKKQTSKELSLDEFQQLGYDTKKEYEGDDIRCLIIEDGYIFEIEESESGRQEVVYVGKGTKLGPRILDLNLSIQDSVLKIEVNAKNTNKYTYIISSNKELSNQDSDQTTMDVDLKQLYEKYKSSDDVDFFGTFTINVIGSNNNNTASKEKNINVSKITFDANGGKFENNEDKYIAFIESEKKLNTLDRSKITDPTQEHYNFDDWYIGGEKIVFDEITISEPQTLIQAGWNFIEHNYVLSRIIKEATCTQTGEQEEVCSICGDVRNGVIIRELGHDYLESYQVDKEATCTEDGIESKHCSRCTATKDAREIKATGHKYGEYTTTKDATCKEEGTQERTCSKCGNIDSIPIAKLTTHTPGEEANCAHAQTCTVCGKELSPKTTTHSYGTKKVSISSSQHAYKCTVCGTTKDVGSHSWSGWKQYSSSNSNYKSKHYKQCSGCSATSSADHSHSKYTYSMMNASQHFKKSTCACGYVINTNPEGHNTKNPCTAQGYVSNAKCSLCGFCVKHSTTSH